MRKRTREELDRMQKTIDALWERLQEVAEAGGLVLLPPTERTARYVSKESEEGKAHAAFVKERDEYLKSTGHAYGYGGFYFPNRPY